MKYLAASLLLLFSLAAIAFGTYLMFTGQFAQGATIFFSSATLFLVFITSLMLTKVMQNTELTISVLTQLVENELIKQDHIDNQDNPPGISPKWIVDNTFNMDQLPEQSKQSRPEDKYATMTLEQLGKEKEKAVKVQDYELAVMLRELIKNKSKV